MKETARAAAAYNFYAAMGPGRSLAKLHRELQEDWVGKKVPTLRRIEEWSARHGWQERVKQYDLERAEEKRRDREKAIEKTNKEHYDLGRETLIMARDQIRELIDAGKFGSQAAVQLLNVAAQLQRIAIGADKQTEREEQTAPIQLIIELDNSPSVAPKIVEQAPQPRLPAPAVVDADDDGSTEIVIE
ncbi:MAG: hypothetical protein ACXWQ5_00765 [Ktedonobacterales bacterium]